MIKTINTINDPDQLEILTAKATEVSFPLTKQDLDFIKDMYDTIESIKVPPLGIAANQIAASKDHIPKIFLALFDFEKNGEEPDKPIYQTFINPTVKLSGGSIKFEEGCLSVPEELKTIRRKKNVTINYQDTDGNPYTVKIKGSQSYLSVIIQHEYDHLNGILITTPKPKTHGIRV